MITKITRRSFLKKNFYIGKTSIIGAEAISGFLYSKTFRDLSVEIGANKPICQVKKQIYIPSPEPRVGTNVSMTVGQTCGRQTPTNIPLCFKRTL